MMSGLTGLGGDTAARATVGMIMIPSARVLPFVAEPSPREGQVGRVHTDGSISFRGETYATIKQVPPECLALIPDQETYRQWKRIYRAIAPTTSPQPARPDWTVIE